MKVLAEAQTIAEIAPAGATIITAMPADTKVGDSISIGGVDLGFVAATQWDHDHRDRGMQVAVVPAILFWHLKIEYEGKLLQEMRHLTAEKMPGHEGAQPGFKGLLERLAGGRGNLAI